MAKADKRLQRIQQLWKELELTPSSTAEYEAIMKKIRVLSEDYKAVSALLKR